jgi:branched-chain amino acid transport system ATP-binding protein
MALLEVDHVHTYYGAIHALKGLSIHVEKGEIVTLIGANGAGKSTTLNTICGLMHPRHGAIYLDGEPIHELPAHQVVRRGVAQAPEGRRVFGRLNVTENLEMGAFARQDKGGIRHDIERVFHLFPRLKERARQVAGTLSGGEQQMLAIGRALMANPRLLLLDEPSMGLAPILVEAIFDTIREINSQGTTILLVEQNALMALSVAQRGYVLETGEIVLQDAASALQENEMVRKAYLGIA